MDPQLVAGVILAQNFFPVVLVALHAIRRGRGWFLWSLLGLAVPILGLADSLNHWGSPTLQRVALDLRNDPITLAYPWVVLTAYLVVGAVINRHRWDAGNEDVLQPPALTVWQRKRMSARTYVGDTVGVALTGAGILGAVYLIVGPLGGWVYPAVGGIAAFALICALVGGLRIAFLASHRPSVADFPSQRPGGPQMIGPQSRARMEPRELIAWEAQRQAARREAGRGFGVALVGLLILGGTYAYALANGGVYVIPRGAIIFGLLFAVGGFLRFLWYTMRRPRASSTPTVQPAPIRVADAAPAALFPDRLKTCPECGASARYWARQCSDCQYSFPLPSVGTWSASPEEQLYGERVANSSGDSVAERLRMLAALHGDGLITDDEFQENKKVLLSSWMQPRSDART